MSGALGVAGVVWLGTGSVVTRMSDHNILKNQTIAARGK